MQGIHPLLKLLNETEDTNVRDPLSAGLAILGAAIHRISKFRQSHYDEILDNGYESLKDKKPSVKSLYGDDYIQDIQSCTKTKKATETAFSSSTKVKQHSKRNSTHKDHSSNRSYGYDAAHPRSRFQKQKGRGNYSEPIHVLERAELNHSNQQPSVPPERLGENSNTFSQNGSQLQTTLGKCNKEGLEFKFMLEPSQRGSTPQINMNFAQKLAINKEIKPLLAIGCIKEVKRTKRAFFLQHFHGPQEKWESQTSDQFKGHESISGLPSFQDGKFSNSKGLDSGRGLDDKTGFERRLSFSSRDSRSSEIPCVPLGWQMLCLLCSSL